MLVSTAASDIMRSLRNLKSTLHCPLILDAPPNGFLENTTPGIQTPAGILMATAGRLFQHVLHQGHRRRGDRAARLPWTKAETKAHIQRRYQEDEQKVISLLANEGSVARQIQNTLALNRPLIKSALKILDGNRRHQTTLASIVCGTFFKYYSKEGERLKVRRPLRNETDSLAHISTHVGLPTRDPNNEDETVEYLMAPAQKVTPQSSLLPIPIE